MAVPRDPSHGSLRIGVLALQGSFREHISTLKSIPGVEAVEVRTKEQLASVSGLIIPGGESTTMANIAERWGLIPCLKDFAKSGRPVWGTCAGLIFLADRATGQKEGGQALLGGLDCLVHRNFFGAQINSFETLLPAPLCFQHMSDQPQNGKLIQAETDEAGSGQGPFRAMFIRAPAILEAGPGVEVLSEYELTTDERASQGRDTVVVAVRSGALLATAFHPELTNDKRWHQLFVDMVSAWKLPEAGSAADEEGNQGLVGRPPNRPEDMPIYDA